MFSILSASSIVVATTKIKPIMKSLYPINASLGINLFEYARC